jgi:hypothetical protein
MQMEQLWDVLEVHESHFKFCSQVAVGRMIENEGGASFEHQIVTAPWIKITSLSYNQWHTTFQLFGICIDRTHCNQSEEYYLQKILNLA